MYCSPDLLERGVDRTLNLFQILQGENKELVKQLSSPSPGSKDLYFSTRFPRNGFEQFKACLWKQCLSYWRSPAYNLMRIAFTTATSLLFGVLFWQQGKNMFHMASSNAFLHEGFPLVLKIYLDVFDECAFGKGLNSMSVQFYTGKDLQECTPHGPIHLHRFKLKLVIVEIPYLITVATIYEVITYPMMGYQWSAYKIFWAFYSMLSALVCFNYLGMLLVSLTPNIQVASILTSSSYTMLILFSGFVIPKAQIPKWWIWLYYICPTSWAMNGMLTSQYGDVETQILAFGEKTSVAAFIQDYFGFHHDSLGSVASALFIIPVIFATLFAYFIRTLNFQRR
ncbi:hypothetical protein V6N12_007912 [Hibiscus sabdariffa]|uniref:ABC-2 type transporter transmembrane domain-containing protein n=1 Tax=Hibiscus sabdariffa TaxID=183260 RepID=A0ABR1ZXR5_9ROSI